jgi:NAD(P)-dependent dehydrogenase (short-subunit alcohol dehydrogenase family)
VVNEPNDCGLEGRVALVTGGARGIGRAIVEDLLRQGASVLLADSGVSIAGESPDNSLAPAVAEELGARAFGLADDIASPEAARAAVALAVAHFGALDLVIANAAIVRDAFVFKSEPANWNEVLRVNLSGPFYLMAAATPVLRDQVKLGHAPGRLVNMISSAGLYGNFAQSAYAAAKAGLVGLTRVAAMDLLRSGVTCNAVAPFAATRVTQSIQPANAAQAEYKERALRVPPVHVARLVSYLCSQAARNVTGQIFAVRGREVFLFGQPRPVAKVVAPDAGWTTATLRDAVADSLAAHFTDLGTDLEAFNSEPLV